MPVFLAALLGGLLELTRSIVGRVLVALGIGIASYSGLSVTLGFLRAQAVGSLSGAPGELVGLLGYLGIGEAVSIISSAYIVRLTLKGLTDGVLKSFVIQ